MNPENTREKKVAQMFAQNSDLETVYVTSDDFGFKKESSADSHAQSLPDPKIETFIRAQFYPVEAPEGIDLLDLSVPKLTSAIAEETNIDTLQYLIDAEEAKENDARKTAVEALQARLDVVIADIEVKE